MTNATHSSPLAPRSPRLANSPTLPRLPRAPTPRRAPQHRKVRARRARVYEKQGRARDALVDLCAILLCQRDELKQAMSRGLAGAQETAPQPPENLEAVMQAVGRNDADAIMAARDADHPHGMPSAYQVTQLLMTYSNYDYQRALARAEDPVELDTAVIASTTAAGSDATAAKPDRAAEAAGALLRRGAKRTFDERAYTHARADFAEVRRRRDKNRRVGEGDHLDGTISSTRRLCRGTIEVDVARGSHLPPTTTKT